MYDNKQLQEISTQVRRDILRMVCSAKSGHPGGSMSSTDILTTLYFNVMKQDPATWTRDGKGQDMFILSAGHMTPVYYSVLARAGYFPVSELATFRTFGARLQGHPSIRKGLPGIFQASGSLGQGLSAACGLALGKKLDKDDNFVFCLCGDGESEEGQIWEAGMFAVFHKLDNLIARPLRQVGSLGLEHHRRRWPRFRLHRQGLRARQGRQGQRQAHDDPLQDRNGSRRGLHGRYPQVARFRPEARAARGRAQAVR